MKIESEFIAAFNALRLARNAFRIAMRSLNESPAELILAIDTFEEKLAVFRDNHDLKPGGALFDSYLKCQHTINDGIRECREAITRLNEKTEDRNLTEFLPMYTLQYTNSENYAASLEKVKDNYEFVTRENFNFVEHPESFSLVMEGNISSATKFLKEILSEQEFSKYCQYTIVSSITPRTSDLFDSKNSKFNTASTTPSSTSSSVGERPEDDSFKLNS